MSVTMFIGDIKTEDVGICGCCSHVVYRYSVEEETHSVYRYSVEEEEHPEAPVYPGMCAGPAHNTFYYDNIHKFYSACSDKNIHAWFFDSDHNLLRGIGNHTFRLNSDRLKEVQKTIKEHVAIGHYGPGYGAAPFYEPYPLSGDEYDGALANKLILEWWVSRALRECKNPGIHIKIDK